MLLFTYWFLFLDGNAAFYLPEGNAERNVLLFAFCLFTFIRMSFMVIYLLKRGITWGETWGVLVAFGAYYIGFPMLGGIQDKPLDGFDAIAIVLLVLGSVINSLSEWLRDRWKQDERNKGKLYTGGLFKYAIHINYFGDVLWVSGFALLTRNIWSGIMPVLLAAMFIFQNIPMHDRYLREKYGEAFIAYEKKTKKFIPFIY